jgi:polyisoprenoid-binding protein YceI
MTTTLPAIIPGTWTLDGVHSELGFTVRHMMVSKVRGRFRTFAATVVVAEEPLRSKIDAEIEVASLDTGNAVRDAAVLSPDYLDSDQFAHLRFTSTALRTDGAGFLLDGDLTVRDTIRPVTFTVVYNGAVTDPFGNDRIGFTATGEINRKDFGVLVDMPMDGGGFVVGDKIKLELDLEFVRLVSDG